MNWFSSIFAGRRLGYAEFLELSEEEQIKRTEKVLRKLRKQAQQPGYWEKPAPWMIRDYKDDPEMMEWIQTNRYLWWINCGTRDQLQDWDERFNKSIIEK